MKSGQWTPEEHTAFLKGLIKYNSASQKWKLIAKEYVTTRTRTQTASHSQKYWKRLRIGLKCLSKPKKNKHCVQCTECEKWYTGRYWTEEEVWALKDWWICDSCEDSSNPVKPKKDRLKKQKKSKGKKRKLSEIDYSGSDSETDAEEDAVRALGSPSPIDDATLAVHVTNEVAPIRCVCSSAHVEAEYKMIECRKCHNLLHKDCIKEQEENGFSTAIKTEAFQCFYCLNPDSIPKVVSSPTASIDSTDAVKSLPLKKEDWDTETPEKESFTTLRETTPPHYPHQTSLSTTK
eukprot:CAMPEP_0117445974 /NCGR_PEP_ID=MMETSP0759-20121206/6087_1 /TAXON_ID=63605 /ORGANISM="Percolomonas cosmopolitus, Strain WS" /LENGTH=290 /DNA_ID=CAMNT_0005238197 /DNA_START=74 /DNA_END=947 /DNA_ORIENTATION=-